MNEDDRLKMKQMVEMVNIRTEKLYSFLRQLLLMAVACLSITASLHPRGEQPGWHPYIYVLAIATLSLAILFGCIAIYGEYALYKRFLIKSRDNYMQHIRSGANSSDQATFGDKPVAWKITENIFYVLLVSSLFFLTGYTILVTLGN
jgi:hypothetical protein